MSTIKFRIAAKTDIGLIRTNNEDNFQASSDLTGGQMRWVNNEICSLGEKGALIVVADGMGGMNAGEVASELAIETVRDFFTPEKLTDEVIKSRFSIEKYMNDAIVTADTKIKAEARVRPETKGMGTTIVIGWILDGKLYISWCGDSRAYIYNPVAGLHQISKDHSYVQSLIDKGSISREDAFDFPDSNIITRCLSDSTTKAKPESLLKPYELCDNDIIMLCTDGLSGMIRDAEIEYIIRNNEHNMDILADELIKAACDAEGSDNITICLCQILQGGSKCDPTIFVDYDNRLNGIKDIVPKLVTKQPDDSTSRKHLFWYIGIACLAVAAVCCALWWLGLKDNDNRDSSEEIIPSKILTNQNDTVLSREEKGSDPTGQNEIGKPNENPEAIRESDKKDSNKEKIVPKTGSIFPINIKEDSDSVGNSGSAETDLTPVFDTNTADIADNTKPTITETSKYRVQDDDTYYSLAKKFNTTIAVLRTLNNNEVLVAGKEINVPQL